jgi:hypothetical protein
LFLKEAARTTVIFGLLCRINTMKLRELALVASVLIAVIHSCSANFVEGDFIPTSRKAQFHKVSVGVIYIPPIARRGLGGA